MDKGKKQIIVGGTHKVLVDTNTGDSEDITFFHRYKEVDKDKFVKLFVNEVQALFDLSKTGLKVFGYVLQSLKINQDLIYIDIEDARNYCGYKSKKQVYKGLSELIGNKIIAMSKRTSLWYINPKIVFNGDRIAFVKEYRLKKRSEGPEESQSQLQFHNPKIEKI